jgi:predicted  nucleic acid-binding Zn-ribbon protein
MKDKYEMERSRNNELMGEIERWKARYMASEKSKTKELDDLRMMMESQRKSMLDREMRELTIKFQAERGNLENEIRKLRESLEYKLREIDEHKQRSQKLEITIMELQRNEATINELESKLALVSQ